MNTERQTRVLGKMLNQYIGKNVAIAGSITKVGSGGEMIEITTFDNVKVNVTIPNPIDGNVEGIADVWGIVKSKGTVEATHFVHLTDDVKDFDVKMYNDWVTIHRANFTRHWKLNDNRDCL